MYIYIYGCVVKPQILGRVLFGAAKPQILGREVRFLPIPASDGAAKAQSHARKPYESHRHDMKLHRFWMAK